MCNKGIPLHNNSNLYNYSEWVKCLVGQNKAAVFSVTVTQCDGMRYNSAKNTSYIPNESVGMLNCDTTHISITNIGHFRFFNGSSMPGPRLSTHFIQPPKNRQSNVLRLVSATKKNVAKKFQKVLKSSSFFHTTLTALKKKFLFLSLH